MRSNPLPLLSSDSKVFHILGAVTTSGLGLKQVFQDSMFQCGIPLGEMSDLKQIT